MVIIIYKILPKYQHHTPAMKCQCVYLNAALRIASIDSNVVKNYFVGNELNFENCLSFLFERLEDAGISNANRSSIFIGFR